jgi:Cof subfamily protein (haloacid dehalogenase superfamily)
MPIKLVILDIDGTLVSKQAGITESVLEAIQQAQSLGVQFALATGRMYRSALPFYQQIASTLPLISYQGALIKNPQDGRVLLHYPVSVPRTLEVLEYFENQSLAVHLYINDHLYVRSMTAASQRYGERTGVEPQVVGDLRSVLTAEPTKVLALTSNEMVTDQVLGELAERYRPEELYLTKSDPTFVEVANPLANKGLAVKFLAEQCLNFLPEEVMTVGDQQNDVEMLEYAGIGVAMGNASPKVQAFSNWVAPSVTEDGVAAAIQKFILS